jgi:choline dehydrogenase-like flavoprotein
MGETGRSTSDEHVVVIGSGPCGAMAAHQLCARGIPVTMLDSGAQPERGVVLRVGGHIIARASAAAMRTERHVVLDDPATAWFSSLMLGGLSNNWTGATPRFAPGDFTDGDAVGERYEWPIGYDDLVRYYDLCEDLIQVTAGDPFDNIPTGKVRYRHRPSTDWAELSAAVKPAGYSLNPVPLAVGRPTGLLLRGTEFNSFHTVVRPLVKAGRLRLVTGAHVTRLNWSSSAGRVDEVEYLDRETHEVRRIRARCVVLAAGALESPRLLMQSISSDFPEGLGNSSGVLGKYLHDHPRVWFPIVSNKPLHAPAHLMYLSRDTYSAQRPLSGVSASIGLRKAADRLRTYARGRVSELGVQLFGTMVPTEDCFLRLTDIGSSDPRENKLGISMHYDEHARRGLDAGRARLVEMFAAGGVTVTPVEPLHELMPGTSVHYGGAARMHRSPKYGVLDGRNRMHDVANVAVCDASSFPTGPEKNPTLTAMAISARAADLMADEILQGTV